MIVKISSIIIFLIKILLLFYLSNIFNPINICDFISTSFLITLAIFFFIFTSFANFCQNGSQRLGVWQVGECGATFSSPDENARAGETAPKLQCQPTLATPLVGHSIFIYQINNRQVLSL